jgi:hypothetical protein
MEVRKHQSDWKFFYQYRGCYYYKRVPSPMYEATATREVVRLGLEMDLRG